jgi:hypothetical protein
MDILWRYDFNISSAVTAPLPQFTLQFSAYIIILYMLETLKVSHLINRVITIDQISIKTKSSMNHSSNPKDFGQDLDPATEINMIWVLHVRMTRIWIWWFLEGFCLENIYSKNAEWRQNSPIIA